MGPQTASPTPCDVGPPPSLGFQKIRGTTPATASACVWEKTGFGLLEAALTRRQRSSCPDHPLSASMQGQPRWWCCRLGYEGEQRIDFERWTSISKKADCKKSRHRTEGERGGKRGIGCWVHAPPYLVKMKDCGAGAVRASVARRLSMAGENWQLQPGWPIDESAPKLHETPKDVWCWAASLCELTATCPARKAPRHGVVCRRGRGKTQSVRGWGWSSPRLKSLFCSTVAL